MNLSMIQGQPAVRLTATPKNAEGEPVSEVALNWSVDNDTCALAVAADLQSCMVTPNHPGTCQITVLFGSMFATCDVTVAQDMTVTGIALAVG